MKDSINVLIVDDNQLQLEIIRSSFESTTMVNFNCITLDDPTKALDFAIKHLPDFIVLDIFMGEYNGLDICASLLKNPITHEIPVMFLTSSDSQKDMGKAFLFGSIAYHKKTDNLNDLVRSIIVHDALTPINKSLDRLSFITREVEDNYED
jgi:CheY-like chemotaxis protein